MDVYLFKNIILWVATWQLLDSLFSYFNIGNRNEILVCLLMITLLIHCEIKKK